MRDAQEDLERLLNDGMSLAESLLNQESELHPFAVVMDAQSELRHLNFYDDRALATGVDLLERLTRALVEEAQTAGLVAVAIFSNTTLRDGSVPDAPVEDAVHVGLEHRGGYSADVFFRYRATPGGVVFDEPVAMRRQGVCFVQT